jgi:hypothetical protein
MSTFAAPTRSAAGFACAALAVGKSKITQATNVQGLSMLRIMAQVRIAELPPKGGSHESQ